MVSSTSFGVTNILWRWGEIISSKNSFLSASSRASSRCAMESWTIVAASTTVGTPIPMTFTCRFSRDNPILWFPTPEPGLMPVSVIWIVLFSLLVLRAASASMAITTSGFVIATTPSMISEVSIPVCAITPGMIPLTSYNKFSPSFFKPYSFIKCLVICKLLITPGPRESAVILSFPSPTTRTDFSFSIFNSLFRCLEISPEISLWYPSSAMERLSDSIVM